jgi:hypothetical protein
MVIISKELYREEYVNIYQILAHHQSNCVKELLRLKTIKNHF